MNASAVCVLALALHLSSLSPIAGQELVPSNRQLIAAMPPGMDSVLVLRTEPLTSHSSPLRMEFGGLVGILPDEVAISDEAIRDFIPTREDGLDQVVFSKLIKLNPVARAIAGSEFSMATNFGIGEFRYLTVWVTEQRNEEIREFLSSAEGARHQVYAFLVDDQEFFSSRVDIGWGGSQDTGPTKQSIAIAFPTRNVTIIGFNWADVVHASDMIVKGASEVPRQWARAADGMVLEHPLVLLRAFQQSNQLLPDLEQEDPKKISFARIPIECFGVSYDGGDKVQFMLNIASNHPAKAEPYFGRIFYPQNGWTWNKSGRANGMAATVTLDHKSGTTNIVLMVLFSLFGLEGRI